MVKPFIRTENYTSWIKHTKYVLKYRNLWCAYTKNDVMINSSAIIKFIALQFYVLVCYPAWESHWYFGSKRKFTSVARKNGKAVCKAREGASLKPLRSKPKSHVVIFIKLRPRYRKCHLYRLRQIHSYSNLNKQDIWNKIYFCCIK